MRLGTSLAIVLGAAVVLGPAIGAPNDALPAFSSAQFGWLADTEFLPPADAAVVTNPVPVLTLP